MTAEEKKSMSGWLRLAVNVCRMVLALTFILSGFVKAIDPLGTQYKLDDYLAAVGMEAVVPPLATLAGSVLLSALEFCLGILLLFAINRRRVSRLVLLFMVVMTAVTVWLWWANPVSDCGCFGDAVRLSNGQTLAKNLVLLACSALVAWRPLAMIRFISKTNQWIVKNYSMVFILFCSLWCLYDLPLFDFRPYHIGADIRQGMEIPEGAKQPQFDTTFILEKDGEQREFTLDNYPDSTWTFVDSRTVLVKEGYQPPIHDFSITTADGEDITQEVVDDDGYTFLLVSPHLETASEANFGEIDMLHQYAQQHGYPFYCLTASGPDAISHWQDITGAEYPFCHTDETTLKTIIRSNPGLLLMHDGKIIRKWSHNNLPAIEQDGMDQPLTEKAMGQLPTNTVATRLVGIMLWFVLPLVALTLADRLWAWTRWLVRRKKAKQ